MGDWTKFGQVSNICPIFVQFMSKFCICPIFVQSRVNCLIFVYYLSSHPFYRSTLWPHTVQLQLLAPGNIPIVIACFMVRLEQYLLQVHHAAIIDGDLRLAQRFRPINHLPERDKMIDTMILFCVQINKNYVGSTYDKRGYPRPRIRMAGHTIRSGGSSFFVLLYPPFANFVSSCGRKIVNRA